LIKQDTHKEDTTRDQLPNWKLPVKKNIKEKGKKSSSLHLLPMKSQLCLCHCAEGNKSRCRQMGSWGHNSPSLQESLWSRTIH